MLCQRPPTTQAAAQPTFRNSRFCQVSRCQYSRRRCLSVAAAASRVPETEAAGLLQQGYEYVDVRTPQEFTAGRPTGSVNIPFMLSTPEGMKPNPEFLQAWKEAFPDTTAQLVVGCKSGNRSARACALLSEEQYSNLVDNAGGFDGWVAAGLPVEK